MESQITSANAPRIRARVIAEAANGPTTFEADHVLREAGRAVIPDLRTAAYIIAIDKVAKYYTEYLLS